MLDDPIEFLDVFKIYLTRSVYLNAFEKFFLILLFLLGNFFQPSKYNALFIKNNPCVTTAIYHASPHVHYVQSNKYAAHIVLKVNPITHFYTV